jgi:hypothetical protein
LREDISAELVSASQDFAISKVFNQFVNIDNDTFTNVCHSNIHWSQQATSPSMPHPQVLPVILVGQSLDGDLRWLHSRGVDAYEYTMLDIARIEKGCLYTLDLSSSKSFLERLKVLFRNIWDPEIDEDGNA